MEKQRTLSQSILPVAVVTGLLLLIPFVAMQWSNDVTWTALDFIVAGTLLFSAGLAYVLISRYATNFIHKAAVSSAVGATLFLIWANLAVGLIGAGPNPGNLLYIVVLAVIIIGTWLSRFTPNGMELTMFSAAFALLLVAAVALLTGMDQYPGSSVTEIIGVNTIFAALFAISGLLFRFVALRQPQRIEKSEG